MDRLRRPVLDEEALTRAPAAALRRDQPALHSARDDSGGGLRARRTPWLRSPVHLRYDVDSIENRDPWFVEQVLKVADRVMAPYHRADVRGTERIPRGAALYVGNHSGGSMSIDSFIFGAAAWRAQGEDALPYALTHDFALHLPGLQQVLPPMGAVRADAENARRLFAANKKVLVYPGGDTESMRPYRDRNRLRFGGRRGYVRLALRNDVPLVPLVGQGSHATFIVLDDFPWLAEKLGFSRRTRIKSWPITLSLPWGFTPFPPPVYLPLPTKIRMEVLDPIRFGRSGQAAAADDDYVAECAAHVEGLMQATLDRLAAEAGDRARHERH